MSLQVTLDDLGDAVAQREFGYLLTVGDDGRPRAIALLAEVTTDTVSLVFHLGSAGTLDAAAERPRVSVLFPPTDDDPYSLIVDGEAVVDSEAGTVEVRAERAVRHRPAPPA
jgi:hypothetical protein